MGKYLQLFSYGEQQDWATEQNKPLCFVTDKICAYEYTPLPSGWSIRTITLNLNEAYD